MIQTQITGRKYEIDQELQDYIGRKLSKLDKYFPRAHQPTAMQVEVERQEAAEPAKRYRVLAKVEVRGTTMVAETSTINPHSAVDVVEAKLKKQIREYKAKAAPRRFTLKRQVLAPEDPELS